MGDLRCTACGAQTEAKCSCGKAYIPAREAAARAVAEHPGKSNRAIAEEIGVSHPTVAKARATGNKLPVAPRTGRDGRKRKVKNPPGTEAAAAALVIDQGLTLKEAAAETGITGSVTIMKAAVHREEGRREAQSDPIVTPDMLSKTAQEKLETAIRQHQRELDRQFEVRVQSEIQRRVQDLVLPAFREQEEDAALVIKSRNGIFAQAEYNMILRCLHPDLNPTVGEKNEAFRLWHARKLVLMSEKDDPRQYRSLPTVEEFMARGQLKKSA